MSLPATQLLESQEDINDKKRKSSGDGSTDAEGRERGRTSPIQPESPNKVKTQDEIIQQNNGFSQTVNEITRNVKNQASGDLTDEQAAEIYSRGNIEIRKKLYSGGMRDYLIGHQCVNDMIKRYKDVNQKSKSYIYSGKQTFNRKKDSTGFVLPNAVGQKRGPLEALLCQKELTGCSIPSAIDIQGYYSIGKNVKINDADVENWKNGTKIPQKINYRRDHDFNKWEKMNCWLCGLPLEIGDPNWMENPVSCEHKNPIGVMLLFGAGIQTAVPTDTLKRINSNVNTPYKEDDLKRYQRLSNHIILPVWKELIRMEGYGWAHSWCNMVKLQAPFFTIRNYQSDTDRHVTYQMEVANIYQFVAHLFRLPERPNSDESYLDGKYMLDQQNYVPFSREDISSSDELTGNFSNTYNKESKKSGRIDPINKWVENRGLSKTEDEQFRKEQAEKAFSNIIKMLIPTYYLLNSGNDVSQNIKDERNRYFGNRTMFKSLDELSIIDRLKDNYLRLIEKLPISERKRRLRQLNNVIEKKGSNKSGNSSKGKKKKNSIPDIITYLFSNIDPNKTLLSDEDKEQRKKIEDLYFEALDTVQKINPKKDDDNQLIRSGSLAALINGSPSRTKFENVQKERQAMMKIFKNFEKIEEQKDEGTTFSSSSSSSSNNKKSSSSSSRGEEKMNVNQLKAIWNEKRVELEALHNLLTDSRTSRNRKRALDQEMNKLEREIEEIEQDIKDMGGSVDTSASFELEDFWGGKRKKRKTRKKRKRRKFTKKKKKKKRRRKKSRKRRRRKKKGGKMKSKKNNFYFKDYF